MAVEVQSGTALAQALQNVVGPKLAEAGWTSGAVDDNSLTEYIILMLINGKTQEQIASELAADLLGLPPDEPSTHEFARWLFEQVHMLNAQINGGAVPQQAQQQPSNMAISHPVAAPETSGFGVSQDTAMRDGGEGPSDGAIPTGPRSMRNGSMSNNGRGGRGGRMLGQLNKAMDRKPSDTTLHKIRGAANSGRINTHGNRDPPRGPRNMNNRMQNAFNPQPGMGMAGMNPATMQNMMAADPEQQMKLLKLLEDQSRMMAEILGPGAIAPAINPAFFPGAQQQAQQQARSGKSLFERVDRKGLRQNSTFGQNKFPRQDAMTTDGAADSEGTDKHKDPSQVPCRYQLACDNPACHFGHQSPAAPPGITTDLADKCSYGAACQNKKCAASHPSPAKRLEHLNTVMCMFFPNCTNPTCPFKHPTTPLCRNGADCPNRDSGCTYAHSDIKCKFNPCQKPKCIFRHVEGQKDTTTTFGDKVWTREGFDRAGAEKKHVSERQFVADDSAEELILPGSGGMEVEAAEKDSSATEGRASPDSLGQGDIVT